MSQVAAYSPARYGGRMTACELMISAGWIVTVDSNNDLLRDASIILDKGRISAILPSSEAQRTYSPRQHIERPQHVLMPGLVNAHTHLAMNLLRGVADDLPLEVWLQEHIWPLESRVVNADMVRLGTQLALAESLRSGVTCVNDMYFFPEEVASVVEEAGLRATLGMLVLNGPSAWAKDADSYFQRGLELHDRVKSNSRIKSCFAPHAPYSVARQDLEKIAMLSTELDVQVHMHLHETAAEVEDFVAIHGMRPMQLVEATGLLDPSLIAVHMTQLNEHEMEQLAEHGVHLVHCPESNMKLASGAMACAQLKRLGINVALGTDGAASNNDIDLLGEMRTAGLLAKLMASDASACDADTLLRMATLDGAKALGIDTDTGSLEPGKAADMIAIDCAKPEMQPMHNVTAQIAYAAQRQDITDVWVDGNHLLRQRELQTLDADKIIADARQWTQQHFGDELITQL